MATITITSPVKGYTGHVIGIAFDAGTATVEHSDLDALAYFKRHGYGLDGQVGGARTPEPPDPREVGQDGDGTEVVGTRLRDAAVDPQPGDFLPPTSAGAANPHGPLVVAPGIHGQPPAPIVPGPVSSDAAVQEAVETEAAVVALTDATPVAGDEDERPSTKARTRPKRAGA